MVELLKSAWRPASGRSALVRLLGIGHDLICASLALPLAFLVRTGELPELSESYLVMQVGLVVSATLAGQWFSLNKGSWRYASINDLIAIIQVAMIAVLVATAATFAASRLDQIPRMVVPLSFVLLVVLMGAPRLAYRAMKDRHFQRLFRSKGDGEPILIIGYSDEANAFLAHMARQRHAKYDAVGIIDHNRRHQGHRLHGVAVVGAIDDLAAVIAQVEATRGRLSKIVISPSKVDKATTTAILDVANDRNIPVYSLPTTAGLAETTHERLFRPVPIRIDDLLGRPNAMIDIAPIAGMLRGRRVMVTGGGGSIGGELVNQIMAYGPAELVVVELSEHNLYVIERDMRERGAGANFVGVLADVRDRARMSEIMMRVRPDVVFHAAALKHVPLVQGNPVEGAKTNILGTINLADLAVEVGASAFILISTDKAVNPTNMMGATKRFAEAYCQQLDLKPGCPTRFVTVRFGNVLGSAGSVVPEFQRQIAAGGPIKVTHPEMRRFFMSMSEAVRLVLAASANALAKQQKRGGILVLNMGSQVKIVDLATRMIQLAGLRPGIDITIEFTGLRPGEKLYEERFSSVERMEPSSDEWLDIATPREVDEAVLAKAIVQVKAAINAGDPQALIGAVRLIVPELSDGEAPVAAATSAGAGKPIILAEVREQIRK